MQEFFLLSFRSILEFVARSLAFYRMHQLVDHPRQLQNILRCGVSRRCLVADVRVNVQNSSSLFSTTGTLHTS